MKISADELIQIAEALMSLAEGDRRMNQRYNDLLAHCNDVERAAEEQKEVFADKMKAQADLEDGLRERIDEEAAIAAGLRIELVQTRTEVARLQELVATLKGARD